MEEILKKTANGKKVSCGVILINEELTILAGHPTGRAYGKGCYDLFKGCAKEGEDDLECAIREMKEESGVNIKPYKEQIIDAGFFKYNKEKVLHLYVLKMDTLPSLLQVWCDSHFIDKQGRRYPEMNGYALVEKDKRNLFFRGIQNALNNIPEVN